jgi:preprotein translocase subunit YajC
MEYVCAAFFGPTRQPPLVSRIGEFTLKMPVLLTFLEFLWWLQPEEAGGAAGAAGEAGPAGAGGSGCVANLGIMLLMLLVFYFLLIKPQQKRQREHDAMLKALRKGAVVRTTGGIRGEITDLTDREATLLIADRVKINVLRSNIAGAEPDPSEQAKEGGDKDDKDDKDDNKKEKGNGSGSVRAS